jgi:hypothetical protein
MSIDMLPDDVLLAIFDFCAEDDSLILNKKRMMIEAWQSLVHTCRRWRIVVFGSPRYLNLRLFCSNKTPVRDMLDVWPALPLFINCHETAESMDNIVAALERSDRVCNITLRKFKSSDLEQISAAMQVPFPELTHLRLTSKPSKDETESVFPDSFLGGSAPRGISFPGLPKLVLSATHLVTLRLQYIPHSGYFSPDTIVTALSTLARLSKLWLYFKSPQSRPDSALPPPSLSVLPALTYFSFKGVSEYLEVVVAHIDAPRLSNLYITFFNDIVFNTPQLIQFISRTPTLKPLNRARVAFDVGAATVKLSSQKDDEGLDVRIPCRELDWQVSSMQQVCTSCLPPLPTLEHLYIYENPHWQQHWQDNIENALWLELLQPFTYVKNLYLSEDIAQCIVPALQDLVGAVGRRATEVLPALQNIFLEGQPPGRVQEGIQPCDRPPVTL